MRAFKIFLIVLLAVVSALYGFTILYGSANGANVPPVLNSDRDVLEITVDADPSALLAGLTASDQQDGDLTGRIQIAGISKLINDNTAKVTYIVFDSDQNMATLVRPVRYTDYTHPRFYLTQPLIYYRNESMIIVDRLGAHDVLDGDISQSVRVSMLNATDTPEIYQITCQVTNSMGDTVYLDLPVIQIEGVAIRPEVILKEYLVYLEAGTAFNARSYVSAVSTPEGSGSAGDVIITGDVNTATPGVYTVRYDYPYNGITGTAILTVVVE